MKYIALSALLIFTAVTIAAQDVKQVGIVGHRGAKGYFPENTIPSFILAIEQGADTIEIDVVISQDKKVVVSHDHWFSSSFSTAPDGTRVTKEKEREHNIYKMTYDRVAKYDVGKFGNTGVPGQIPLTVHKPLLTEVFAAVEKYTTERGLPPVWYNIEIKSSPQGDNIYHPETPEFVDLILKDINAYGLGKRVILQSFDVRPLQLIHKISPDTVISFLVSNQLGVEKNLENLGFVPDTYSPSFSLMNEELVRYCREKRIKLVPWTVNNVDDMIKMRDLGIDAIITDYPDRAVKVFRRK
ncbi:MAG: glycerophosphodiester phosphodiesterase [Acidobacteria bacterium]|nr:glycerophosphodiester phosphodiesterase [Acidobacteriota bacterium]